MAVTDTIVVVAHRYSCGRRREDDRSGRGRDPSPRPSSRLIGRKSSNHARLETERCLRLGCEEQQRVGYLGHLVDEMPALCTERQVGQRLASLGTDEYSQGQFGRHLAQPVAVAGHVGPCASARSALNLSIAEPDRVLAVPSGTPSASLISLAV